MKIRCFIGKCLLASFGNILPNRGFRRIRTHWARMISKNISKNANICRGAFITGNGNNLYVGSHSAIGLKCSVGSDLTIGEGTMMGPECIILTRNHKFDSFKCELNGFETKPVIIGKKCWIGARAIILPGAKIGNYCIVGGGAVVPSKEYPDYSLIVGNPAVVKRLLLNTSQVINK